MERSGPKIKLLAVHEASCETSNADALTRALTDARRSLRITAPVVLGIPSTSAILTTVHPLVVNPQRAALAVQFELQQHLPFDLTDAAWHYRWLAGSNGAAAGRRSGLGAGGSGMLSLAQSPEPRAQNLPGAVTAAIRRSVLEERLACCRRAGLTVAAAVVNPVAALNVCDAKRTLLKSASALPVGAPVMTVLRLVDQRSAEWIISAPAQLHIIPVTSGSPDLFWQELASSWDALRAQGTDVPTPVWVIGSPEAFARAQEILPGQRVERFDVGRVVAIGTVNVEQLDRLVAALGLALQGLGLAGMSLNLLAASQSEAQTKHVRRIAAMISGVCLAATLGLGLSGMMEVRQRRVRVLRVLDQREWLYQTLRPEVRSLLQQEEHTERRNVQLEQLVGESPALTLLVAQLSEAMPHDVWLTAVECSKAGLINGVIEGRAKSFQDVTKFLEQLKTVAGMTTVKPMSTNVTTDEASGKEVIAFSVQVQRPLPSSAGPAAPKGGK